MRKLKILRTSLLDEDEDPELDQERSSMILYLLYLQIFHIKKMHTYQNSVYNSFDSQKNEILVFI